jgi:hypothetical protein
MMNLMIDIEALACPEKLLPGHLVEVCQIAGVFFEMTGETYGSLNLFPAEGNGLADPETAAWWMQQTAERGLPEWWHRRRPECAFMPTMKECLNKLGVFLATFPGCTIWAKNPAYDKTILAAHYAANLKTCPFLKVLDVRTLQDWYGLKAGTDTTHNAMADCMGQIQILKSAKRRTA